MMMKWSVENAEGKMNPIDIAGSMSECFTEEVQVISSHGKR